MHMLYGDGDMTSSLSNPNLHPEQILICLVNIFAWYTCVPCGGNEGNPGGVLYIVDIDPCMPE